MSTETIFRQLGRLNDSHTGIGPGKTREEYLNLFSRASYSTQNEWPYSSPFAGFYDISNTSTGLILVNQRYRFSHLRGKIVPKESSHSAEAVYKRFCENILESEQRPKQKHTNKLLLPRIPIDPYRHFESRPQTARSSTRNRNRSLSNPRRSQSASVIDRRRNKECQSDPAFAAALWQYYLFSLKKSERPKVGLQQYHIREPSNRILRKSGIYHNPALTRGQQLYLLQKCHIYDTADFKTRQKNSHLQVLANRFHAGLNDPRDYFTYKKFVKTPRQTVHLVNTGYFSSKQPHHSGIFDDRKKKQHHFHSYNSRDKENTSNTSNSSSRSQKLANGNSVHSSQRISASSLSTSNEKITTLHLCPQSKEIPKIPVLSLQSSD